MDVFARTLLLSSVALAALTLNQRSEAADPVGYLDNAGCDAVTGWAQDPDQPTVPIDVHVYFGGPPGSGAPAAVTNANVYREDLCAAIGSCEHGFIVPSPLSLHDGVARNVHAYGIDIRGVNNPQLGASPKQLSCVPPAQTGVRRRVPDTTTLSAWKFVSFWDLLPLGDAEADAMPDGPDLPSAPELVRAASQPDQIWLVDRGVRRPVAMEQVTPWRFDLAAVEERPAAEIDALVEGTALRPRPVIFIQGALFMIDDPQPEGQSSGGGSSGNGDGGESGDGGAGGAPADGGGSSDGGSSGDSCAYAPPAGQSHGPNVGWLAIALFSIGWGGWRRYKSVRNSRFSRSRS